MMTETTTSSSSSAVKSARLEAVTTTPPSDESAELDKAQREAIAQMVRQAKDAGVALTGPDGLLKALTEVHPEPWRVPYAASRLRAVVS